ncbi:unnamed protein product [Phytomonas sp. Hart1]|nr:unnamed protein product [Phytomonas sp. Hart1]|eukprot:CCW70038.1 unnamed protein product [Phytomonas sp. isolate Hart1]
MMIQDQNSFDMSNSTSLSITEFTLTSQHSPAAVICAFLIAKKGFTCFQLSQILGLPPLVIEECIRNDVSSDFMRNQLVRWLNESKNGIVHGIPLSLIAALQEINPTDKVDIPTVTSFRDYLGKRTELSVSSARDMPDPAKHDRTFSVFTPFSEQYFKSLQSSVGQSFISILNDPEEFTESSDWGARLSSKIYEALDYNGHSNNSLEGSYRASYHYQPWQKPSSFFLTEHISRTDYNDYVNLVSAAYHTNRNEGQKMIETLSVLQGSAQREEDLPWPDMIPEDFFSTTYAPKAMLMQLFSVPSDDSAGLGRNPKPDDTESECACDQKSICSHTFAKDFEVLEQFGNKLRMWETSVENCLLRHAQSHSENFLRESRELGLLSDISRNALKELSTVREVGGVHMTQTIHQYLSIGRLYQRRNNIESLSLLLSSTQRVLQLLQDIENWIALPEREISELSAYVHRLLDLEVSFRNTIATFATTSGSEACNMSVEEGRESRVNSDQASSWSITTSLSPVLSSLELMPQLNFMTLVPSRIAAARKDLEQMLCSEVFIGLENAGAESSSMSVTGFTRVLNAAAHMRVLSFALRTHRESRLRAQWGVVRETVINFLINWEGCLSNVKADRLLSLVLSPEPTVEERKSLLEYCSECRFDLYIQLLEILVEALVESVTKNAQCWGYFILECALDALSMHENKHELLAQWTFDLFIALYEDAESVIAIYLELRCSSKLHTNIAEVERLVRIGNRFVGHMLYPLSVLSSLHSEVLSNVVGRIRLGKQIGVIALNLAKYSLKAQHTQQMEKLNLVLEAETWASKDNIDTFFQAQLEHLCSSDGQDVEEFISQSIELPKAGYTVSEWDAIMTATSDNIQVSSPVITVSSSKKTIKDDEEATFYNRANRLYLSLNEDDNGRAASNSLLILLELLANYDSYLARFPSLGMDVASKMYEVLALYDNLCASMVLGAQAMKNGVLTNITTLHLCVASQCVAFLADFTPRLQQRLVRLLGAASRQTITSEKQSNFEKTQVGAVVLPRGSWAVNMLLPFIDNDFKQVIKGCQAHRNDFFNKISSIVLEKVDRIGLMEGEPKEYNARGNEWIMTILREVARLIRSLRPLLPPNDLKGIVVPLLGFLSIKIREVTKPIPASDVDSMNIAKSDILLFKANVERFGYDVLRCVEVQSVNTAMCSTNLDPCSSDRDVLAWFLSGAVNGDI